MVCPVAHQVSHASLNEPCGPTSLAAQVYNLNYASSVRNVFVNFNQTALMSLKT